MKSDHLDEDRRTVDRSGDCVLTTMGFFFLSLVHETDGQFCCYSICCETQLARVICDLLVCCKKL